MTEGRRGKSRLKKYTMQHTPVFTALILALSVFSTHAHAGGVSLGATRVVYKSDDKMKQLSLINSDDRGEFLMQSWIEDEKGQMSRDLAVIPPLVLIRAASQNTLRLVRNKASFPADRESLYWLNVKAIPEKSKDGGQNTLQFAITNRIKLFYRPAELAQGAAEAYRKVKFSAQDGKVNAVNPTPYYVTLTNISISGHKVDSVMLAPRETRTLTAAKGTSVEADSVNDYGGLDHFSTQVN